jgi:hypothetical protein
VAEIRSYSYWILAQWDFEHELLLRMFVLKKGGIDDLCPLKMMAKLRASAGNLSPCLAVLPT